MNPNGASCLISIGVVKLGGRFNISVKFMKYNFLAVEMTPVSDLTASP